MPRGVFVRSLEYREKQRKSHLNKPNKGHFSKGSKPYNTGKGKQCWCKECRVIHDKFYNMAYNIRNKEKLSKANKESPHRRFINYRSKAKMKGMIFTLTLEDFKNEISKPCGYCGETIAVRGLDRIDNNVGYILSNIISCCPLCNYLKRDLTVIEFKNHIRQIFRHSGL